MLSDNHPIHPVSSTKRIHRKRKKEWLQTNLHFHSIGHTLTFKEDISAISECAFICPMMCHDGYIDASTNSPLYLLNQGGCPGYKSGSATPSPGQGGGDPFVSCFYSKLKHCKSYFGISTQTTGITMLVIVCIFLIAN